MRPQMGGGLIPRGVHAELLKAPVAPGGHFPSAVAARWPSPEFREAGAELLLWWPGARIELSGLVP